MDQVSVRIAGQPVLPKAGMENGTRGRHGPGFHTPPQQTFDNEEMRGSLQKILAENIGEYVLIEFLIGTERMMRKQGLLYSVGTSYVTLYDDSVQNYIVCDLFSIKFIYFYLPGQRPNQNYNLLPRPETGTNNNGNGRGNGRGR